MLRMPNHGYLPEGRNYPQLFVALDDAIGALLSGDAGNDLIEASFGSVAEGFGAEKAIALAVAPDGSMRALASRDLSPEDIEACVAGRSVPGISSSKIRESLERKASILVQDPRHIAEGSQTRALEGLPYSILCAPILDPGRTRVLAVFYAQNFGFENAFGEIDLSFIEVWAHVMGRILAAAPPG
jgi:hypothetical protein